MKKYIEAYRWLYAGTKKEAIKAVKEMTETRRNLILEAYLMNCKKAFYQD